MLVIDHGRTSPHYICTNAIMGERRHIIFVRMLSWANVATLYFYECYHGRTSPHYICMNAIMGECRHIIYGARVCDTLRGLEALRICVCHVSF